MQAGEISGTLAQFVTAVMKIEQSRFATVLRLNPAQFQETFHAQASTDDSGVPEADLEVMRLTVALASGQVDPVSLTQVGAALDAAATAGAVSPRLRRDWADATASIRTYLDQAGAMPRPPEPPDDARDVPEPDAHPDTTGPDGADSASAGSPEPAGAASEDPAVADGIVAEDVRSRTGSTNEATEAGTNPSGEAGTSAGAGTTTTPLDRAGQGDRITREEVLWVVVDGLRAAGVSDDTDAREDADDIDHDRARQFDAWRHAPPFFGMVERLFLNAMVDLIATLSSMRIHIVQPALTKVIAAGSPGSSAMIDRY